MRSSLSAAIFILNPAGKFSLLLANVHEAGPTLQCSKWTAAIFLVHLPSAINEASIALSFDFTSPHTPLNRSQFLRTKDEAKARDECRYHGLEEDIARKRSARLLLLRGMRMLCKYCMEDGVLLRRVTASIWWSDIAQRRIASPQLTHGPGKSRPPQSRSAKSTTWSLNLK